MKKSIVMFCCFLGLTSTLSAQPPDRRPQDPLDALNESVRGLNAIIDGHPMPQDLAKIAWSLLPAQQKKNVLGPVIAMNAYYRDERQDAFDLEVLSVVKSKFDGKVFRQVVSWDFKNEGHGWERGMCDYSHSTDSLYIEMLFWCRAVTFPPTGNAKLARTLHTRLLTSGQQLGSIVSLIPKSGCDIAMLQEQIQRWNQNPANAPKYIGVTVSPYNDAILYVDDGACLWGFLWRNERDHWLLSKWEQSPSDDESVNAGRVRLCTIGVKMPTTKETIGGAGTTLPLLSIDSTLSGKIVRLFRLCGLNSQLEVFGYFKTSISKVSKQQFWQTIQAAMATFQLEKVTVTMLNNGQFVVNYPTPNGLRAIRCALPNPEQLVVVDANVSPTSTTATTTSRRSVPTESASRLVNVSNVANYVLLEGDINRVLSKKDADACWMNLPPTLEDIRLANELHRKLSADASMNDKWNYVPRRKPSQGVFACSLGLSRNSKKNMYILWIGVVCCDKGCQHIEGYRCKIDGAKIKFGNFIAFGGDTASSFIKKYCVIPLD